MRIQDYKRRPLGHIAGDDFDHYMDNSARANRALIFLESTVNLQTRIGFFYLFFKTIAIITAIMIVVPIWTYFYMRRWVERKRAQSSWHRSFPTTLRARYLKRRERKESV